MNTGEWVTAAIAVVALAVSVVALVVALRSARIPKPVGTAGGAADQPAVVEAAAPPQLPVGVAWAIEHDAGISFRLRNIGTEPAFDVNAVGLPDESAGLVKLARGFADVPVNGSLGFNVVRTAHHPNVSGLAVTWSGQSQPVIVAMNS
jgi:hypothetical protein